jgi:AcrR family transcriptional regulator
MVADGRSERSRRTRARIVEAARNLFVEHGYVVTKIDDVAAAADVAVQTVYYAFGTKPTLLARVLDFSIAGDLEPVPILERPWVDDLRAEDDPHAALGLVVDKTVEIVARVAPVYAVVQRAAADPEVGRLLDENRRLRYLGQRGFVEILYEAGHLHDDLDLDTATDVFYGLMSEDLFELFVDVRGWDVARYRDWMVALLTEHLVTRGFPVPTRPRGVGLPAD